MSWMESLIQQVGEQEFRRAVTRSVVGVGCTVKTSETDPRQYFHASGFLLDIEDTWFFVTAGHVLNEIEQYRRAGYTVEKWHFDDSAGWSDMKRRIPPPFTFQNEDTFIHETEAGHDYGAIKIKPFHRKELEANGKIALIMGEWLPDDLMDAPQDIQAMCIVGVPGERIEYIDSPDLFVVNKDIAFCEVIPLPPSEVAAEFRRATSRFYGEIAEVLFDEQTGISVENIKGMSGGPIFGLSVNEDGSLRTTVLAIQSSWFPMARIITGCPVRGFPEQLIEFMIGGDEKLTAVHGD